MSPRAVRGLAALASLVVLLACARSAAALLAYPWDWSPDEGLVLDFARRLVEAPATLYGRALVPSPSGYTPLVPLLVAPVVWAADSPLFGARLLALGWAALAAAAVFILARRRSGVVLGLVAVALALAPRDFSVWFVLVRFDGLMIALWLAAACALMPSRLEKGADALSRARLWTGALLLLASVLAKPTAAIHGAPLVLGWFLVDRASAWRLTAVVAAGGLGALGALQLVTGGGFLWTAPLWAVHPRNDRLFALLLSMFVSAHAAVLLFTAVAVAWAWKRGARPFRDGAWLLVLGGLAILPALAKSGAWTNYLLPFYCGIIVLACRLWPQAPPVALLAPATLALALLARPAPVPTAADAETSAAFYGFVRERGAPILALRPDYAYFVVGQPVEAEGSGFTYLVAARVPGTELLLHRVRGRHYRLIVTLPYFWPNDRDYEGALTDGYTIAGTCALGFASGRAEFVLLLPKGDAATFGPHPGARCRSFTGAGGAAPPS